MSLTLLLHYLADEQFYPLLLSIFGQFYCTHKGMGGKHDLQKLHQSIHQRCNLHETKP